MSTDDPGGAASDHDLVERALQGDREAFGQLAERYYRMVSVLAIQKTGHRADAEDIVQEAYVRAYRALGSLREGSKFAAWIYNITLKLCIDWLRRRERRDGTVPFDDDTPAHSASGRLARPLAVGDALEASDEQASILRAMGALPDRYRLVITLRYVRKMSYKEIAEHLGEPAGTVANRLHRATRMLQERMGRRVPERALEELS
ncbi:MAG: sigma-70 family RNA polymerase sigma factor [Planctomycetes bacterium]|nr:sigma-70 family RNA polymerase sigma factor [Planctomycetota bacterium]MCW8138520.1 sigma-70 family RNA polymerase sigma factor [Planctomycetota bacterium]